ncbi:hypothetical protein [Lacipirellula limnantheis]|uniref:Uncharacterized protein n=1 Tax=Lacipirellula limnantheis TaxID=2528024 RepID=A0A517TYD6_9BACT|nr:hypothetical protein [Lacipirellula limnantheis]QDT73365.1 hypothetical protein I41_25540 [Lacipirellula limnantheis]
MSAIGRKFELPFVSRVFSNVGAMYGSPMMREHQESEPEPIETLQSSESPSGWLDLREAVRGWGFFSLLAVSVAVTLKLMFWLFSALFF